jgi:hypothetical protein
MRWQRGVGFILKELGAILELVSGGPTKFTLQLFNGVNPDHGPERNQVYRTLSKDRPTVILRTLRKGKTRVYESVAQDVNGGVAEALIALSYEANYDYIFDALADGIRSFSPLMRKLAEIGAEMSALCKKAKVGRYGGPMFSIGIFSAGPKVRLAYGDVAEGYRKDDKNRWPRMAKFESEGETMVAAIEAVIAQAQKHLEANRSPSLWKRLLQCFSRKA